MTAQPVVLGPGQGWQFWISVSHGTVKVEFGKGHFSIYESPGGPGPAPHIHRSYVEEWLVTEAPCNSFLATHITASMPARSHSCHTVWRMPSPTPGLAEPGFS
jgi:hypothetical protein